MEFLHKKRLARRRTAKDSETEFADVSVVPGQTNECHSLELADRRLVARASHEIVQGTVLKSRTNVLIARLASQVRMTTRVVKIPDNRLFFH